MIPFYLITGFLGSGKTTLLQNILALSNNFKVAIIQNEFAPTGIDGKILKTESENFRLVEINNGSVFCVCQLPNFIEKLIYIVEEYSPQQIFLEASGLSDPINIAEILQHESLKHKLILQEIFCLVDAENFYKGLNMLPRFRNQIMVADRIVLNKCDKVENAMIQKVSADILKINPFASITETTFCNFDFKLDSNLNTSDLKNYFFPEIKSGTKPDIQVSVFKGHCNLDQETLFEVFRKISQKSIRAKGIFHLPNGKNIMLQGVFGSVEMKEFELSPGVDEMIAFGELTPNEIKTRFQHMH